MKVNIAGVGLVPRVGLLAPVYGRDLTKDTVAVILNYSSFKVYAAATGLQITKSNIDDVFSNPPTPKPPISNKADTKPEAVKPPVMKSHKYPPVVNDEEPEEIPAIMEETTNDAEYEILPEITEDNVTEEKVAEPVITDEKEEETKPVENNGGNNSYRNNNKKNKKRH